MNKQYAHLHAMAKTSVKFQNDWPKTVGGVALTSQIVDERTNGWVRARLYPTCVLTQVRQKGNLQNLSTNNNGKCPKILNALFYTFWPKFCFISQLLTNGQTDGSWHAYIAPALARRCDKKEICKIYEITTTVNVLKF